MLQETSDGDDNYRSSNVNYDDGDNKQVSTVTDMKTENTQTWKTVNKKA